MAELETENGVITDPVQIAETLNDMFANVASRLNINNRLNLVDLARFGTPPQFTLAILKMPEHFRLDK